MARLGRGAAFPPRIVRATPAVRIIGDHLASSGDDSNLTTYTTASITPLANRLILAWVVNTKATTPDLPTLTGNDLTWVQVATTTFNVIAVPTSRVTLFRAMGSSPTAGAVSIDFAGVTQTSCAWSITTFNNVDTSGTNGSGAIAQSATNNVDTDTSLTVTLAAFERASNATAGGFGTSLAANITVGSGYAALGNGQTTLPPSEIGTEWRNDNDTSVDASFGVGNAGGIAVELRIVGSAPAAAITNAPNALMMLGLGI